jgi:hypothetical protein
MIVLRNPISEHMKFFVRKYREPLPKHKNIFVLTRNSWDDYGTVCLFTLSYVDGDGDHQEVGEVKILSCESLEEKPLKIRPTTMLDESFPTLDPTFISLGQSESYYQNMAINRSG